MSRNDPCWCGSQKKWKKCHYPLLPPMPAGDLRDFYKKKYQILLKTPDQIAGIRRACEITSDILDALCIAAKEGVSTEELDLLSRKLHKEFGATPAPLGYGSPPFPKSICTSINEVICHGIPDNRVLKDGDIMNIDVSAIYNGYIGDSSRMVMIGTVDPERKNVVDTAYECLMQSINILKPGVLLSEIGRIISKIATERGCSVVYQFVGHGCGVDFHEEPQVQHSINHLDIPLAEGMTFTIEPMINAGRPEAVINPKDKWTATTIDGRPSAQWEHLVLITKDGHEILTLPPSQRH